MPRSWPRASWDAGFQLVSGGTDNHLMLVDLRPANITGKEMEKRLDQVNITVNKNTIPDDPQSPFVTSGIRVGVPAATSRGLREEDMKVIGQLIWKTATEFDTKQEENPRGGGGDHGQVPPLRVSPVRRGKILPLRKGSQLIK